VVPQTDFREGTMKRRDFLRLASGAAALPALSGIGRAQSYPSRPIKMVVPFPAGGGTDIVARAIAERMRLSLGQPVVIENVGGGNGTIGTGRVSRVAGDGYTTILGAFEGTTVRRPFPAERISQDT
jgi:tripartite-type tricarboxylate transporter receptor subunit TctC